jgi:hypothetical protein
MSREYRKCPSCGEQTHDYMFPWVDPDATAYAAPARVDNAKAQAKYQERVEATAAKRKAAQAKGRNYAACLPCINADGGDDA